MGAHLGRSGPLLLALVPAAFALGAAAAGAQATFKDEGKRRGLTLEYAADLRRSKMIGTMGGGVAASDYDNDGDVDLYVLTGFKNAKERTARHGNALYRNRGDGTFEDAGPAAGVDLKGWSMGAVFADTDGDGFLDLYVTCLGPNKHYRNRGDGTFEDMGARTGIANPLFGSGAAFADFDRDGDLDLLLVNYLDTTIEAEMSVPQFQIKTPSQYQGQPSVYYENRGDGTFADATARTGTDNLDGKGLGVRAIDFDQDGWLDVFIANDTVPNRLYRNPGTADRWEDEGLLSGTAVSEAGQARAGMGVASGDVDGDGLVDLFVTNFSSEPSSLYHNDGGGVFHEITKAAGLVEPTLPYVSWGTSMFDGDLDGDLDLAVVNSHLVPKIIRMFGHTKDKEDERFMQGCYVCPVQLFANDRGAFTEMNGKAGDLSRIEMAGRGLATADVDGDGDLDVVVSARDRGPALFLNDAAAIPGRHWLEVKLRGRDRNPFAIGATVVVKAGELEMRRAISAGGSYLGSEPPVAHFGLGPSRAALRVTIIWPRGGQTVLEDVPADRVLEVREETNHE
ncbi:MAG: CRTAC1 family protein [Acidobacteriota bacterium]